MSRREIEGYDGQLLKLGISDKADRLLIISFLDRLATILVQDYMQKCSQYGKEKNK